MYLDREQMKRLKFEEHVTDNERMVRIVFPLTKQIRDMLPNLRNRILRGQNARDYWLRYIFESTAGVLVEIGMEDLALALNAIKESVLADIDKRNRAMH